MRRLLENLLAFLLRHAPQHGEGLAFAVALELIESVEDLLFGLVANAASVVEHQFRILRRWNLVVPLADERADDFLGVMRVHLTTEGFDVKGLHLTPL